MKKLAQILICRLPYSRHYDAKAMLAAAGNIEERGLICVSIPLHVENPAGAHKYIVELLNGGLHMVASVIWHRQRFIVVSKGHRLTNTYEHIAVFSRSPNWVMNKEAIKKLKQGTEGKTIDFNFEAIGTCAGDLWHIANDRRDRRFLPAQIILQLCQLGDLKSGDAVYDPYCNPTIKEFVTQMGWKHIDGGLPSPVRGIKKGFADSDTDLGDEE